MKRNIFPLYLPATPSHQNTCLPRSRPVRPTLCLRDSHCRLYAVFLYNICGFIKASRRNTFMYRSNTNSHRPNVGGVAQWLGCPSVAGRLSLICAWSMVDVWPLCG